MVREEALVFLRHEVLVRNQVSNGQPWNHVYISNTKQTQQVVFMHVSTCNNNNQRKRDHEFEREQGSPMWEELQGGGEEWNNVITL